MPESGKTILGDIYLTMSYNETGREDFSSILNWLSNRGNVLTSILGENWLESSGPKDEFQVAGTPVSISYLDTKRFESLLKSFAERKLSQEAPMDEKEIKERVHKFQKLVEEKALELSIAESVATQTPLWQIRDYDLPTWRHQINSPNNITIQGILDGGNSGVVVLPLNQKDYSMLNMLTLLLALIRSDDKFSVLVSSNTPQEASCFLPVAYIIDVVNKSKIRKAPIDLLLLDRSSEENIALLAREAKASQVFLWGAPQTYSSEIFSGVLLPNSPARAAHFILDSSADVETAVDSIAAEVWCSGSNVGRRARSLLFVHQPVHNKVLQLLETRMNLLKTSPDSSLKSRDFIKRTRISIDSRKTQELKGYPRPTDFSLPTLLWDIGTSCDLIASRIGGLGHVLFVIPYRSPSELLSLANNYGDENEIFIHASNLAFVKSLASAIKGTTVVFNAGSSPDVSSLGKNLNRLNRLLGPARPSQSVTDTQKNHFGKLVVMAEKSLKSWESIGIEMRYTLATRVFQTVVRNTARADFDGFRTLTDLVKVAWPSNEQNVGNKDRLMIHSCKPYGVSGLILLDLEKMSNTGSIIPILILILKGNVSIVVSVSQVDSPLFASLESACNLVLPPGVVHFIRSPSLPHAIHGLSGQGKVPLLWIVHAGTTLPTAHDIPDNSFSKVVVDHVSSLEKSFVSRSKDVEIPKIIYF